MRIAVFGDKGLVHSAFAEMVGNSIGLDLVVNLHSKASFAGRVGCSTSFLRAWQDEHGEVPAPEHDCIEVSHEDDDPACFGAACQVVFIAENEQEVALLGGLAYEQRNKDQYSILKLERTLLASTPLARLVVQVAGRPKP